MNLFNKIDKSFHSFCSQILPFPLERRLTPKQELKELDKMIKGLALFTMGSFLIGAILTACLGYHNANTGKIFLESTLMSGACFATAFFAHLKREKIKEEHGIKESAETEYGMKDVMQELDRIKEMFQKLKGLSGRCKEIQMSEMESTGFASGSVADDE